MEHPSHTTCTDDNATLVQAALRYATTPESPDLSLSILSVGQCVYDHGMKGLGYISKICGEQTPDTVKSIQDVVYSGGSALIDVVFIGRSFSPQIPEAILRGTYKITPQIVPQADIDAAIQAYESYRKEQSALTDPAYPTCAAQSETKSEAPKAHATALVNPDIQEHTHTKKGFQMFLVTFKARVDRATYQEMLEYARSLGGWYSRQWQQTPAGFAFKSSDKATKFLATYL